MNHCDNGMKESDDVTYAIHTHTLCFSGYLLDQYNFQLMCIYIVCIRLHYGILSQIGNLILYYEFIQKVRKKVRSFRNQPYSKPIVLCRQGHMQTTAINTVENIIACRHRIRPSNRFLCYILVTT